MKKLLMTVIAGLFFAGVANAANNIGFWFGSGSTGTSAGWSTYVNIQNTSTGMVDTTVLFYDLGGYILLGSTTRGMGTNENWNFATNTIGTVASTKFDPAQGGSARGGVVIIGNGTSAVTGYTTIFNSTYGSGFTFGLQ